MRVGEDHRARGEAIQVRRVNLHPRVAVHEAGPIVQVVDGNEQDVGTRARLQRALRRALTQKKPDGAKQKQKQERLNGRLRRHE